MIVLVVQIAPRFSRGVDAKDDDRRSLVPGGRLVPLLERHMAGMATPATMSAREINAPIVPASCSSFSQDNVRSVLRRYVLGATVAKCQQVDSAKQALTCAENDG